MKFMKKALVLSVVLTLLVCMLPMQADAATEFSVKSGSVVTLDMTMQNIWGFEVESISVSSKNMVKSITFDDTDLPRALGGDCTNNHPYYTGSSVVSKAVFHILVKIVGDPGDSCTVTVNYKVSVSEGDAIVTKTPAPLVYKISIKKETPAPPPTTPTTPTAPAPTVPMELEELNKQITVAEGLEQAKYTADSWTAMQTALQTALKARESRDQAVIDKAAAGLKDAIAALVKMDYLMLTAAIDAARILVTADDVGALWAELSDALNDGLALLNSGDQAKVDAAAQRLTDAVSAVQRYLAQQEDDVPEETLPQPTAPVEQVDRCDYPSHKTWPVLFWISLSLNIACGVLIISYVIAKAKNRKDTTPLVEYNIEDDDE